MATESGDGPRALPTGTVTFLFTDIEGSTRLLQDIGAGYPAVLAEHFRILRDACIQGVEVNTEGDAIFVAFASADEAVAAAAAAQDALAAHDWPAGARVRVRMGIHTGAAEVVGHDYVGLAVHEAARICAAAHGGQILLSDATRVLSEAAIDLIDLGEHRLKDIVRPVRLYQVAQGDTTFPPPRTASARAGNLPVPLTSFVGRDDEVASLLALQADARLLTLTGPGGVGKTRLAIELARQLGERHPDGIWFVDLAPVTDPALVPAVTAHALGLRESADRALQAMLLDHLSDKNSVLVMDNCEHLLDACVSLVATILERSPEVRVLATAREPLGVGGEVVWRVPAMVTGTDADRLFRDRARSAGIDEEPAAEPVRRICERLDGIPLAIELAAAKAAVLGAEEVASRLDDRFRLLTGGERGRLERHQTLRAAVAWSWDLLSEPERALLAHLTVFSGGFTVQAAEHVCAGDGVEQADILGLIGSLVSKSMVTIAGGSPMRYTMLETVRQFAREKLAPDETARLRDAHLRWFTDQAVAAVPDHSGLGFGDDVGHLAPDIDNIRAALDWSDTAGDAEAHLAIASRLWPFWAHRGHLTEGRRRMERARALAEDTDDELMLARVLDGIAQIAYFQEEYATSSQLWERCRRLYARANDRAGLIRALIGSAFTRLDLPQTERTAFAEEGLEHARAIGSKKGEALSLQLLWQAAYRDGDKEKAAEHLQRSYALALEAGSKRLTGYAMAQRSGFEEMRGDIVEAHREAEEALAIFRELNDRRMIAFCLARLGYLTDRLDRPDEADAFLAEALEVARSSGITASMFVVKLYEAERARLRGALDEASALADEATGLARGMDSAHNLMTSLTMRASIADDDGRPSDALADLRAAGHLLLRHDARLHELVAILGLVAATFTKMDRDADAVALLEATEVIGRAWELPPAEREPGVDAALEGARARLGDEAFEAARARGRAMTVDEGLAFALGDP